MKNRKKGSRLPPVGGERFREAVLELLDSLTDDHTDCLICDRAPHEGHDPERSCGLVQKLIIQQDARR